MANVIKRGESILIPFYNGESVRDSQNKPRIYRSKEQYEKFSYISRGAELVEYAEVVRCKDCKWYKEGELLAPNKFCFRLKHPTEDRNVGYNFCDDDFCSYGERKDNG